MSPAVKKAKKYARYGVTALLLTGMVLVTGFLSFTGMLVLNESIYLAIAAFLLAGGIEGEVYAQNISSALLKLFSGKYWEEAILEKTLAYLVKHDKTNSAFLKDYKKLVDYIAEQEHAHHLSKEARLKLEEKKKDLAEMRRIFRYYLINDPKTSDMDRRFHPEFDAALTQMLPESEYSSKLKLKGLTQGERHKKILAYTKLTINKEISKKMWLSRFSAILTIGAGISCGLVGLEVAQSSIAALVMHFGIAISSTALTASVFGLAIVGAIGYTLLIYNTISDMIKNDTLRKWAGKTQRFFHVKVDEQGNRLESKSRYIFRVISGAIGVSIIVGLGVFATVATAGTWWHAAKAGAEMVPWLAKFAAEFRSAAVSLMGITSLLFTVVNSLKSARELAKVSLVKWWTHTKNTLNKYFQSENIVQLLNPFRFIINLITIPFKFVTFVGHLFSMGIMGDKLDNVHPWATAFLSMTSEAMTDAHYFLPEEEHINTKNFDVYLDDTLRKEPVKNSFIITRDKDKPRLLIADEHGHQIEVFNSEELSKVITALNMSAALEAAQGPSIKKQLPPEQLSGLLKKIREKINPKPHIHDHQHLDLPGRFLKFILSPLYLVATGWDYFFSQMNEEPLTFKEARHKLSHGFHEHVQSDEPELSKQWQLFKTQHQVLKVFEKESFLPTDQKDLNNIKDTLCSVDSQIRLSPFMTNGKFNSASFFSNTSLNDRAQSLCKEAIKVLNPNIEFAEETPDGSESTNETTTPTNDTNVGLNHPFPGKPFRLNAQ